MTIKISIVTVVFNGAATIDDAIQSVMAQNHPLIEHIVVDGLSKDGTLDILKKYEHLHIISEKDSGIYDAMNKGIATATGDVIGFLNADDVYNDENVLSQVAKVFKDASVDGCYADLVYVDQKSINKIVRYWKSRSYRGGLFESGWMPAHPTFFVRRSVYEQFGGFDLSFPRQADFELTMRMMVIHKIRTEYVPRIWVRMRMGGISNNSLRGVLKGNLEAWRACRKNGLKVGMLFIPRKIFSRIPQFFSRPTKNSKF